MIASLVFLRYGSGLNIYAFAILFCFTLILHFVTKYQENKLINEGNGARAKFRKIGERIPIMYDELEIKTNSWMQEVEVGSGTQSRNEYVEVNLNVIILEKIPPLVRALANTGLVRASSSYPQRIIGWV